LQESSLEKYQVSHKAKITPYFTAKAIFLSLIGVAFIKFLWQSLYFGYF